MTIDDEAEKKNAPVPPRSPLGPAAPTGKRFRLIDRTAEHAGRAFGVVGGVQPPKAVNDRTAEE